MITGSEPSLTSRNGHRSSVNASKRTLTSQENVSPHHNQDNGVLQKPTSPITTEPARGAALTDDTTVESPSKTPSYLKLSCAVSGYNKYMSYNSPTESHRIKVIKRTDQNGSASSESSQGHDDLDGEVLTLRAKDIIENGPVRAFEENGGVSHEEKVTSGRTEIDASKDDSHKFVTKATVRLEPALNGHSADHPEGTQELKLSLGDLTKESDSNVSTPGKVHFIKQ